MANGLSSLYGGFGGDTEAAALMSEALKPKPIRTFFDDAPKFEHMYELDEAAPGALDLLHLGGLGLSPLLGGGPAGVLPTIGEGAAYTIAQAGYTAADFLPWGQSTGGGGGFAPPPGGGLAEPKPVEWIIGDYDVGENAPEWWRPFTVKDSEHFSNPEVAFTLMANSLIGSGALSEEDARSLAKHLYTRWGGRTADNPWDIYSDKFPEQTFVDGKPRLPKEAIVPISREQELLGQTGPELINEGFLTSSDRGRRIIDALSAMREATVGGNVHEFGPGYQYLQSLAGAFEAGSAPTRAGRQELQAALDPLVAQSRSGELGAFSELARMVSQPFFTNLPGGPFAPPQASKHLSF